MGYFTPAIEQAIQAVTRLPGIGRRTAQRLVLHMLMRQEPGEVDALVEALQTMKNRVHPCERCNNLTENESLCEICSNAARDTQIICVVENFSDLIVLEKTGEYRGLYHVLGGVLSPLDGIGPTELQLDRLFRRVDESVQELIIATNPSVEGDATATYIAGQLADRPLQITRLARGIPMGGHLDYVDPLTLSRSLAAREKI